MPTFFLPHFFIFVERAFFFFEGVQFLPRFFFLEDLNLKLLF